MAFQLKSLCVLSWHSELSSEVVILCLGVHLPPAAPGKLWALTCFAGGSDASPGAKPTIGPFFPIQNSGQRLQYSWLLCCRATGLLDFLSTMPAGALFRLVQKTFEMDSWVEEINCSSYSPFACSHVCQGKIFNFLHKGPLFLLSVCYFELNNQSLELTMWASSNEKKAGRLVNPSFCHLKELIQILHLLNGLRYVNILLHFCLPSPRHASGQRS